MTEEKFIIKDTKHVAGLNEEAYRECCYSCTHCRVLKSGSGECKASEATPIIKRMYTYRCPLWEDAELSQCAICDKFMRHLGGHVRTHNMTSEDYKESFGINRTTSLASKGTKKALSELALKHGTGDRLVSYASTHTKFLNTGMTWTLRDEAIMNMQEAKADISEETRAKMRLAQKGVSRGKGRKFTAEHRANLSKSLKQYFKSVIRTIVRDAEGKIVAHEDRYRYWKRLDNHYDVLEGRKIKNMVKQNEK